MQNKKKIKIINIVGARPNFMKIAPLYRAYRERSNFIEPILVHTNQHKDTKMSDTFFKSLGIPQPDYRLTISSQTPTANISEIMIQLEAVFSKEKPDLILVVGDVNSTLAAAITASKMRLKIAHVESGLRSRDRSMPEEINRIIVDHLSDLLFVTEKDGLKNLKKENIDPSRVFFTGNVMIDNLIQNLPLIERSDILEKLNLKKIPWSKYENYAVMTMHRPANVDTLEGLEKIISLIEKVIISNQTRIIFPIHPRTLKNLEKFGLLENMRKIQHFSIVEPMDYLEFIALIKKSAFIMTDSGGIQEEAAYLKIPTITLRESTERPSTIESGANYLVPLTDPTLTAKKITAIIQQPQKIKKVPLNDGKASKRIVEIIIKQFSK